VITAAGTLKILENPVGLNCILKILKYPLNTKEPLIWDCKPITPQNGRFALFTIKEGLLPEAPLNEVDFEWINSEISNS
jgi:hypothetical protein